MYLRHFHAMLKLLQWCLHTVQCFGYGETGFQAQANCFRNAKLIAEAWITMQSFLQN
jgi:hypothetical protein